MFRSKATKKYAALDEAIARVSSGQPIESVASAYPEAERASLVKMLGIVSAVQSLPKVQVPAPSKRRLYLDPAYQKSKNGVLAFINSFKTFGYAFTAVIVVFIISGTAYAASKSLPGDTLFTLKAGYENAQLALATTPLSRAQLQVQIASERLADAQTVLSSNADSSSKATAISYLNSATSQAVSSVQAVVKSSTATAGSSVQSNSSLAQSVEQLAAAQQQLVPAASVAPGQAQALADIQTTVAAAQASQNPASIPTPATVSVTGKLVAIANGSVTVDTNKFTIDPRNIKITDTDGFNLSFAALAVGETVKISAQTQPDNTNLVNVITIISQAPAAPTPTSTPTVTPTTTTSASGAPLLTMPVTTTATQQTTVPAIPVKPNDTYGGVIFEN